MKTRRRVWPSAQHFGKDHNIWIQTYANPRGPRGGDRPAPPKPPTTRGRARIIAWGYYGSESNDYAAKNRRKDLE